MHPRGLVYADGDLWVSGPPLVYRIHDVNSPGAENRVETIVTGTTTNQIVIRGGDHTTNGITMGIDGWLYLAVGDYGIKEAEGTDGAKIVQRGGGMIRFRPDGSEMEVFATGTRNIFQIAIDPYMNVFTRDNTNDGGGWDVRLHHFVQTADFGYTRLYANFTDETMPSIGVFGNGGGTGTLWLEDPAWPDTYNNTLYSADWGRSMSYRHVLTPAGPTFTQEQIDFVGIPQPTGMAIDGSGRLYLNSWKGGSASRYIGPDVGFVSQITPPNFEPREFPDLKAANMGELVGYLKEPNYVLRFHTHREILRRGTSQEASQAMKTLARDAGSPLYARAIAVFTLKQLDGAASHSALLEMMETTPSASSRCGS